MTFSCNTVPRLGKLIENCSVQSLVNGTIAFRLKKFDSKFIDCITQTYTQSIKTRRKNLGLTKNKLASLCNISPSFVTVIESKYPDSDYDRLENMLEYIFYDRNFRSVLRAYKQKFPEIKSTITKNIVYTWLVKTLIHEILLTEEIRRESFQISKSKKIPIWKIDDAIVGLDRLRYV